MPVTTPSSRAVSSSAEAPNTLTESVPGSLSLLDQLGFWGNLGVSLLGFAGALSILTPYGAPTLTLTAATTAIVVGSVLGGLVLGTSLVLGVRTGAPAMVVLRGLLGAKASFVPAAVGCEDDACEIGRAPRGAPRPDDDLPAQQVVELIAWVGSVLCTGVSLLR